MKKYIGTWDMRKQRGHILVWYQIFNKELLFVCLLFQFIKTV